MMMDDDDDNDDDDDDNDDNDNDDDSLYSVLEAGSDTQAILSCDFEARRVNV